MASAHYRIATLLAADGGEKSRHRTLAREIYTELIQQDPKDVDALLGMSSLSEDENERIELLRKAASVPSGLAVDLLAEALARRDGNGDALEAAQTLEAHFRSLPRGSGWGVAASAVRLYERAGVTDRRRFFMDRLRDELAAPALLTELRRIPGTTSVRAGQILDRLCDRYIFQVLGNDACLDGWDEMAQAVAGLSGPLGRTYADVLALMILDVEECAGPGDVQHRISSVLVEMNAAQIDSPVLLLARARFEPDPLEKTRLLDRAAAIADDIGTLRRLADEYMVLRRRTDAVAVLRRLRELQESERQAIDRDIELLELAEQRSLESGWGR